MVLRLMTEPLTMPSLDPRSLLPPGLLLEAVEVTSDTITISARREGCQSARKRDPGSACKRDPLLPWVDARGLAAAEP
jgi:hypothetical protein